MRKLLLLTFILSSSLISAHASDAQLGEKRDSQCVEQDQSTRAAKADADVQTPAGQTTEGVKVEDKG